MDVEHIKSEWPCDPSLAIGGILLDCQGSILTANSHLTQLRLDETENIHKMYMPLYTDYIALLSHPICHAALLECVHPIEQRASKLDTHVSPNEMTSEMQPVSGVRPS